MRILLFTLLALVKVAQAGFQDPLSAESLRPLMQQISSVVPAAPLTKAAPLAPKINYPNPVVAHQPVIPIRKPASLPVFDLRGLNREEVRKFSRDARAMALPTREYGTEIRARGIATKFAQALHPFAHKLVRTPIDLFWSQFSPIIWPEKITSFEWQLRRFDALLQILDKNYYFGMSELWWLGSQKDSPTEKRARDYLFAGLAADRADLPYNAYSLWNNTISFGIENNPNYLSLLWDQLPHLPENIRLRLLHAHKSNSWLGLAAKRTRNALFVAMAEFSAPHEWIQIEEKLSPQSKEKEEIELLIAQRSASSDMLETLAQSRTQEIADQANLQLARIKAAASRWDEALTHYQQVRGRDRDKIYLLLEQAYVESRLGQWKRSLGKSLSLESEFFRYGFIPEAHALEASSRKSLCDYGGSEQAVLHFHKNYDVEQAKLKEFFASTKDPEIHFERLLTLAKTQANYRFVRYLLHLPEIQEAQGIAHEWWTEHKKLSDYPKYGEDPIKNADTWKLFLANQDRSREAIKTRDYLSGGKLIEAESKRMLTRLQTISDQTELMQLDVAAKASSEIHLQNALNFPVRAPAAEAPLAQNKNDWGFKQEIWEDELEYLESKRPSRCVADQN